MTKAPTERPEDEKPMTRRERSALNREAWTARHAQPDAGSVVGPPAPPMPDPRTQEGRDEIARAAIEWGWRVLCGELPGTNMDRIAIARELRITAGWGKETPKSRDLAIPLGSILRPTDEAPSAKMEGDPHAEPPEDAEPEAGEGW